MKITQKYNRKQFEEMDRITMHELFMKHALTERQIAVLYGVTKKEVHAKRLELNVHWMNSAIALISGPRVYRWNTKPKIKIK